MKFIKTGLLVLSSLLAVTIANAKDLRIYNGTENNITFKINDSCSNQFGIISTKREKIISVDDFSSACKNMPICKAEIYHTDDCSGEKIGDLVFDKTAEVKNITPYWAYQIWYNDNGLIIFPPLVGRK